MSSKSRLNVEFARTEVGLRQTADAALQSELDVSQVGSGLEANGSYVANAGSNYLTAATSLKDADNKLDAQIKTVADNLAALGAGSLTDLQNEVNAIETGAGLNSDGTFTADGTTNYIGSATSLKNADKLLDTRVKVNADAISAEASARSAADAAIQGELNDTQVGAGLDANGDYIPAAGTYIGTATSIHNATQRLDTGLAAEVSARQTAVSDVQTELNTTQSGAGLNGDGTYSPDLTANYIDDATSLKNADKQLDTAIKAVADDLAALGAGSLTDLQNELNAVEAASGLDTDGSYIVNGTANYISTATDLADADDKLDAALKTVSNNLNTEIINRTQAVSDEATTRAAQDDVIEAGAGLETNGTYAANLSTNYLATATSLKNADEKLDIQVKANETAIAVETSARVAADNTLQSNIDAEETARIATDAALQTELNDTQLGAGLDTDGSYIVNAGSNYLAAATSLADADNKLDARAKTNADAIAALQTLVGGSTQDIQNELDATQLGAGLGTDGTYTANGAANYIDTANSLKNADNLLDAALKAEEVARIANDVAQQTEIDDTQAGAGLDTNGGYTANATANYISGATSLKNADDLLDAAVKVNANKDIAQDAVIATKLPLAGGTMTGNINMDGHAVTGLPAPVNASDAANKAYVDGNLAGLSWKNAAVAASGSNITLANEQTVDGVAVVAGDRVLVMGQTNTADNGIYLVVDGGAWTRTTDFDQLTPIDEINGAAVYVEAGTTYGDAGFTVTSTVAVLDTDPIVFTQFNGASSITAGVGLGKTGNTLYVNLGAGIKELPSDEVGIETLAAGGLFTTEDGSTESLNTAARLAIKLDGTTLTTTTSGAKVSDSVMNSISTNATDIANEVTDRTNADAAIQTELNTTQTGAGLNADGTFTADPTSDYISAATSLKNATSLLDDQVKANADAIAALDASSASNISNLQAELDATQVGAGLAATGAYVQPTTTNYLNATTTLAGADAALDTALKAVSDVADAAEPDLGVGIDDGYVLITSTAGVREWVPFNQTQVGRIQESFTATAGQSVFNVNYDPDVVDVFLNGFKLVKGSDFTAADGTSITVSPALTAGDLLEVVSYEQYVYANVPQLDELGDLWVSGDIHANAFYTDSLRALKTNIVPSTISAVDMINATEIVEFNYKTDLQGDTRIGFIADDTDPMMASSAQNQFDIANTVGVLLKAIQELSAEVADLKAQLGA